MPVFGRLGALFVVLGGAALLLVDGLRSPPGLWYAAASVVAGTMMVAYTVISSPSPRRPQPASEPASPSTSDESTTASTTHQSDSQSIDGAQTAEVTESANREVKPASDEDLGPSDPPTSDEQPEPPSTTVKRPQPLPANTKTTQRTTSYTNSSRTRKMVRTATRRKRHVTSTASPRRKPSTRTDNSYFTPVEWSREIKFTQVDTRFSYLDIDWGLEFIGLDPIPDLIEVDVGLSAVSQELVRSPVEIKISSLLKALLAPTSRSSGTAVSDGSTRPSKATDNLTHRRIDDARTGRRPTTRDAWETRYRKQNRRVDRHREPLAAFDERQQLAETRPQSSYWEPVNRHRTTADTPGYGSWEDMGASNGGRSGDHRSSEWELIVEERPISTQEMGAVDEPPVDVGIDYSPPRWDPPQWDADPFGLADFDSGFSEPEEPVMEPFEQPELGFGMSDWEPNVSIEKPTMDLGIGAEMLGLDGFAEPPEEAVGLPGLDVESGSNPLLPDTERFFPKEDVEDDWLSF